MRRGNGSQVLKAVVRSTTLRRTKEMKNSAGEPLVKLPGVQFFQIHCELDEVRQQPQNAAAHALGRASALR